jgi:hypothetical protein
MNPADAPKFGPAVIELWRAIREGRGEPDSRALLAELGHLLGYDHLRIEPHRVPADGQTWRWANAPEHFARFEEARSLRLKLDEAVKGARSGVSEKEPAAA